jgi:predicted negative regulator of RcsB-dependent stress response
MFNMYLNEYEQWNALKKWWHKYNGIIILAFSMILLSISAYKYWRWHEESKLQFASNLYEQMMLASANHQNKQIKDLANQLVRDYPKSIYADAARLNLAKIAVAAKNYDKAEAALKWVAENSQTSELADVAKIRLARVWLAKQQYKDALGILKNMHSKAYLPLVDELRGDIYTAMNQYDKAVDFYRKALSEVQNYGVGNLFLEMKSNDSVAVSHPNAKQQLSTTEKANENA